MTSAKFHTNVTRCSWDLTRSREGGKGHSCGHYTSRRGNKCCWISKKIIPFQVNSAPAPRVSGTICQETEEALCHSGTAQL